MNRFEESYTSLKDKFYSLSKIDIAKGTVMDMIFKSFAYVISEAHELIEKNKKPYLFTSQKEDELDSTGYFLQCPRLADETDENYLYRLMKWTQRNATNNIDAINDKIKTLSFSSSGNYVPLTDGVGTATVYLIPYKYEEDYIKNTLAEAEEVLSKVISPGTIVEYMVPQPISVKLVCYLDVRDNSDSKYIQREATKVIKEYINNIAPGERLMLGKINNMVLDIDGVEYFNVVQIYLNDKESTAFEILQTVSSKMLYDEIIWWEVDK